MAVNVKYNGGPRHGKKATLKNYENAPQAIRANADAKALNFKSGYYSLSLEDSTEDQYQYVWVS